MTTIQLYPQFYKTSGKLNIKNIMKTADMLNNYIAQYKKEKIKALILDNTFINNKKIKIKGPYKKTKIFTIYSKDKNTINKIYNLEKQMSKKKSLEHLICHHIELYKLMGIKYYKRRLKYIFVLSISIGLKNHYKIQDHKKRFNLTYKAIKKEDGFKILDDIIKECKNNMK